MKRLLIPFLLLAVCQLPAADLKIGVVDMVKAFNEFYKTKDASSGLQESAERVRADLAERQNNYKKLLDEAEKLDKARRDPVLNLDQRSKLDAQFQSKAQELRAMEREIAEFQQRRKNQLEQEQMEKRRGIYQEISKAVEEKAKSSNLDFVMDKASVSMSGIPLVLYLREGALPDITPEVIVELNKNAPPASATPASSTKKDDSSSDKPSDKKKKK